jgi:protein-disulfide isomerase
MTSAGLGSRNRGLLLGGVVAIAVAVVVALVLISSSGGDGGKKSGAELTGVAETREFVGGLKQRGTVMGDPGAPVTVVEFVDPQCPFCAEASANVIPPIVDKYVRTGKVKIEMALLTFIGPDSRKAGLFAAATALQNRLWGFMHLLYANQGEENSGYVTTAFLTSVGRDVPGLDEARAATDAAGARAAAILARGRTLATRYAVDSTPTFLVGRSGGQLRPAQLDELTGQALADDIEPLLR